MSEPDSTVELDVQAVVDYRDSVDDSRAEIERAIDALNAAPGNADAVNALFRALHNVKGNAKMCRLDRLSEHAHHIENLVAEVRANRLPYLRALGELVLLALDELRLITDTLARTRAHDEAKLRGLEAALENAYRATPDTLAARTAAAIAHYKGEPAPKPPQLDAPPSARSNEQRRIDLAFFHDLAQRLYAKLPYATGRVERTLPLIRQLNAAAPQPVDAQQLEAALYVHDIGLAYLTDSLAIKESAYTAQEWETMQRHPEVGAQLLRRIPGWDAAALMVEQHHAWMDGSSGYPATAPCVGAQMLALVDAYESITSPRPDRQYRRSVLQALTEINNNAGRQFSAELAPHFINIVRERMKQTPAS